MRARGAGRRGRGLRLVRARARGALACRCGRRGHGRRPHERCDAADRHVRHRGAEDAVRAPARTRGEVLGAFALTEPGSGSDAGSLRTTAAPDGDGWRITGSKQWCTNGSHASTFLLFARTDPATEGARGVSAFLLDAEHVEVTREEEKLGLHSSSTADLRLDDVRVDADRLLHEERKGFAVAMSTLDGGRIGIASQAVGIAQAALDTRAPTRSSASSSAARSRSSRRFASSSRTWRRRSRPRAS